MLVETDLKVKVELEIESIEPQHHSRQITPNTPENDWWGESEDWTTYTVKFTNGARKEFANINDIEVLT